jgi:hypothetical protein
MALMNPLSEQMHLGSRLHELGMALMVQFCCAEEEQDSHQPKMALLHNPLLLGEAASDGEGGRGGWQKKKLTAHSGREARLCAEAKAARRAVTTTVKGDMAEVPGSL